MSEKACHNMITIYDLWNNDWLSGLYDEQHRWISCYLKENFWAGLLTINLNQFMKYYENTLKKKVELEWLVDLKCLSKKTLRVIRYEMKKQIEDVYTIFKFKEYQQELIGLMYCEILDFVELVYNQ